MDLALHVPEHWDEPSDMQVTLVKICTHSDEFRSVSAYFKRTGFMIHKVERIQNALLHYRYSQGKARFTSLGEDPEEIAVFHGTSNLDPREIYTGGEGVDLRFSSDGLWGRATYFCDDIRMADSYAYTQPGGNLKQIIMLRLSTGRKVELAPDATLKLPPYIEQESAAPNVKRFDTVTGVHPSGYRIYTVYANERSYPEYLITYF